MLDWTLRVATEDPEHRQLFRVKKTHAGYEGVLEHGDIILTIDGSLVTRAYHLDVQFVKARLSMLIIRKEAVVTIDVATFTTAGISPFHCAYTAGAMVSEPPFSVRQNCLELFSNVYLTHYNYGSPANRYGFNSAYFIMKINGASTPTFERFCVEMNKVKDGAFVRIDCLDAEKVPGVKTTRKDELYFPSQVTFKDADSATGWSTVPLSKWVDLFCPHESTSKIVNGDTTLPILNGTS